MTDRKPQSDQSKPGPEPERVKIEGDWEEAVSKALKKQKPDEGWPEPPKSDKKG